MDKVELYHFTAYQDMIDSFCIYDGKNEKDYVVPYPFFGLVGEIGEAIEKMELSGALKNPAIDADVTKLVVNLGKICERIKKVERDNHGVVSPENKEKIKLELGDVLFYLARVAHHLDIPLQEVAEANIAKLSSRKARNVIQGSGDNR